VICTEPFTSLGQSVALAHGLPDFSFVIIPHPVAPTAREVLASWVDDVVHKIVVLLVQEGQ